MGQKLLGSLGILLVAVVFTVLLHSGEGLKCYTCNSYDDPGCADFFNNQTYVIHRCPDDAKYCRKVVQETFYEGKWHMRYIRQCAREGELDGGHMNQDWNCFDKIGTYRVKVKYCHCIVDGCNAAAHVKLSRNIALIPIGILLLRQWLF